MIEMVDVMELLSQHGWTSYRLRKEQVLPEGTLTRLRSGKSITLKTLNTICELCECQPGDILRYVPGEQGE